MRTAQKSTESLPILDELPVIADNDSLMTKRMMVPVMNIKTWRTVIVRVRVTEMSELLRSGVWLLLG